MITIYMHTPYLHQEYNEYYRSLKKSYVRNVLYRFPCFRLVFARLITCAASLLQALYHYISNNIQTASNCHIHLKMIQNLGQIKASFGIERKTEVFENDGHIYVYIPPLFQLR